ncbi:ferredoxin [Nonomuraea polychroma]|uniref:Ferredoxin n=1 Tax=Nonomuraea polychroma TaxID=46176 RepID=A0A438M6I8_9ACTN|nr:ferredoxin [Nonomuraea polychroma]RVX41323.1 ferredoxin [Nonomuraea polychroma]
MNMAVDQERCVGAGQCVIAAPEVFDQREDGIVLLLEPSPGPDLREAVGEAALLCPAAAIHMTEQA